ncbi:MAG: zinc-binding dehydrogenase [Streptosporangiales bacterium]
MGESVSWPKTGDHVILAWIPPCGRCRTCLGGQPNLCTAFQAAQATPVFSQGETGVQAALGVGAFADETVVPVESVVPIPEDVPFEVAALVGCGVMTGVGAVMNTAKVAPGSNVVVVGCGGVGINVVQGSRLAGAATILAVDRIPWKRDLAVEFGATRAVSDAGLRDAVRDLTAGVGFDYAFEVVGQSSTIRAAWDVTRRGGTTVVVGAGSRDDEVRFNAAELFFSERRLLGCLYGSADVRRDFVRILDLWRANRLKVERLVSRRISLDEVNDAFAAMERGEVLRSLICA